MNRTLLSSLAVLLLANGAPAQSPAAMTSEARVARVERGLLPSARVRGRSYAPATIEERMRALQVPAVSVAVVDGGKVAWAKAYGLADVESKRPATTETLFQAASISKPVAATAALQLVAEGKLALDEDVNAKLRSWKVPANEWTAKRPVTLRGLLTHSAGLTVHGFPGYGPGPVPTVVQVLAGEKPANTAAVVVDVEPGTKWRYSGGGITVMQQLLEDVAGVPFAKLMRDRVLAPAGMASSTFEQPLPAPLAARAATAYKPDMTPVEGRYHVYPEAAAAGLWTTPTDLARWIVEVQNAAAGRPSKMLSREMAAAMLTPGIGGWGLGIGIGGEGDAQMFSHGGSNEGFRATLIGFTRRGQGVVVMTNSDNGARLASEIVQAVAAEYGLPGLGPREVVPVPMSKEALAEYAGRYEVPDSGLALVVEVAGDGLLLTMPAGEKLELVPVGGEAFALASSGAQLTFERGPDGKVTAMDAGGTRARRAP